MTVNASDNIDVNSIGDYVITYQATDSSNNISTETRIVKIRDRIDPTIILNGLSTITIQLNQAYIELGASATDNFDNDITVSISGTVNTALPGTYTKKHI